MLGSTFLSRTCFQQANIYSFLKENGKHLFAVNKYSPRLEAKRCKGHSHAQNVRSSKLAGDALKSQLRQKICREIRISVRESGPDPKLNRDLDRILNNALHMNVPKETIQRAIQQAISKPYQTFYFDIKGPGSSFFVIDTYSESNRYMHGLINKRMSKCPGGFNFVDVKTSRPYFTHNGIILVAKDSAPPVVEETATKKAWNAPPPINYPPPLTLESAETLAIEMNAESVNEATDDEGKDAFEIVCDPVHVKRVEKDLQERHYNVLKAVQEFRPLAQVTLSKQHMEYVDQFYELLEEVEEIEKIFDNIYYDNQ